MYIYVYTHTNTHTYIAVKKRGKLRKVVEKNKVS